ncbi:pentapeptide repeat-containing protein [Anaerosporobacter sp.]|uniref:pentapeptide repeat-containing protein n=1 Tax=Anaerosporobacter sp. TaxID=1872529 RepID=UPI00286F6719|nr:pentapeptide repeat-containing protein [Anaerosporobacter sp.]
MREDVKRFYRVEVEPRLNDIQNQMQKEFIENGLEWKKQFLVEFQAICKNVTQYCEENEYEPYFLIFHLLRTRIQNHDFRYQVRMYNQEWYLEEGVCVGDFSVTFIYARYEELWNELQSERLKYVGKIKEEDVRCIMMEVINEFQAYITRFLRENIREAVQTEEYMHLIKGNRLEIKTGEYFEIGDFIFIDEKQEDKEKQEQWLDEQNEGDEYTFEDFRGIILKNKEYVNLDLRYADFSNARFENVVFNNCMVEGTRFDGCDMGQVRFE